MKHAQTLSIPVVSYDWLEDSFQKRRRLVERKYTLEVQRAQRRTRKTMKRLGPLADSTYAEFHPFPCKFVKTVEWLLTRRREEVRRGM